MIIVVINAIVEIKIVNFFDFENRLSNFCPLSLESIGCNEIAKNPNIVAAEVIRSNDAL